MLCDPSSLGSSLGDTTERNWAVILDPLQLKGNFTELWDHRRQYILKKIQSVI